MPSLPAAQGVGGTKSDVARGVGLEKNQIRGQPGVRKNRQGRLDASRVEEGRYLRQSTDPTEQTEP
jgi:hypothetical protein